MLSEYGSRCIHSIYFDLRSRGLPLECGPWINESFWSRLDCSNPEVADISKLAVTRLVLEVDTRWAAYADCNIRDGVYSCSFEGCPDNCTALTARGKHECDRSNGCGWDDADGRCEVYGCANITSKLDCIQGYHRCVWEEGSAACSDPPGPPPKCNTSLVGFLNLSTVDWGQHPHPGHHESTVDYWHGNVLTKTYGNWYSTMPEVRRSFTQLGRTNHGAARHSTARADPLVRIPITACRGCECRASVRRTPHRPSARGGW